MRLVQFTLHDDRAVLVNPDRVAFVLVVGGNASIPMTRIVMSHTVEPIDVRETQAAVARLLQGQKEL